MAANQVGIDVPNCQHANLDFDWQSVATGSNHTGRLEIRNCRCPECGQQFEIMGQNGPVEYGYLPLMERSKAAEELRAKHGIKQQGNSRPNSESLKKPSPEQAIVAKLGGDGVGTRLALRFFRQGYVMSCQACDDAARNMNTLGPDGCRAQLDALVEEMLPRAEEWASKAHPLAKKLGAVVGVDKPLIRRELRKEIEGAIADYESAEPKITQG